MLPYQTSADKALWLTYDLFAELVRQKLQEKQIELLDLKGNPLSEAQFIQIQWDARIGEAHIQPMRGETYRLYRLPLLRIGTCSEDRLL